MLAKQENPSRVYQKLPPQPTNELIVMHPTQRSTDRRMDLLDGVPLKVHFHLTLIDGWNNRKVNRVCVFPVGKIATSNDDRKDNRKLSQYVCLAKSINEIGRASCRERV